MISQVISAIPAAGKRGVDTRDVFVTKQEEFQDHLYLSTVSELNTYRTQVNSTATDINDDLTAMQPVLTNITPIVAVGNSITNVNTVAADISKVNTVSTNIANVNTTAGSITNVNNVGTSIANVNTVAADISKVNTVSTNIANVNMVAPDISKVNTVSTNIGSVNTVSGSINNVNTTATNIGSVNMVAGGIGSVNTVSGSITNVNTTAANIANVNTIATNITDVTYFADIYQGTKTVAPTLRNDGSALQVGDMYFHNNLGSPSQSSMMVYAIGGWIPAALSTAQVIDISSVQDILGSKTFYDSTLKVRATDAKIGTIKLETGAAGNVDVTLPKSGGTLATTASPTFTGTPAAPTAATGDSSTQIATTAFVNNEIQNDSATVNTVNALVRRDASGNFSAGTITAALTGNASTATNLSSNRTFALTGDVTGTVSSNLSSGASIATTVVDDSHNHTFSTVTGLQTALDAKVNTSIVGQTNGIAQLDATGKVPTAQLPAYVDDVLEYAALVNFPATGEAGKIYVALDTNKTYRWSGSVYVYITSGAVDSVNGQTGVVTISNATTSVAGLMSNTDKTKLDTVAANANNYVHPTTDGSLHVPATSTTNNGKVLMAGATAGSFSWQTLPTGITDHTVLTNIGTNTHAQIDTALTRLLNTSGTNTGDQTITLTGDITGSGTGSFTASLSNTGVTAGTYTKITTDAKGRVTAASNITSGDVPNLDTSKLTTGTLPVSRGGTGVTTSTGSGNVVLSNSPVFVTPSLGVATGTSFNGIAGLSSTLPIVNGAAAIGVSTSAARADHVHPLQTNATDTTKLPLAGGTMTGAITAVRETKVAMAANDIDLSTGNLFTKTIAGATTLTVSNVLASGNANSFLLELTNAGSAVITWWTGVKWAGGIAPTLTTAGVDIIGFYSHDGGTTWRGMLMSKDNK